MASISTYLQAIKTAIYGREVRGSIHDALEAMNRESESALTKAGQAVQSATEANRKIDRAISDSNQARTAALDAVRQANEIKNQTQTAGNQAVQDAQAAARSAQTTVNQAVQSAQQIANTAVRDAQSARDAANTAKSGAESAKTSAQSSAGVATQKANEISQAAGSISTLKTQMTQAQSDIGRLTTDKVSEKEYPEITLEMLNNPNYKQNYEGDTNLGRNIGLPVGWVMIKYMKHTNNNGYGVQIAIPFEDGVFRTIYVRNSNGLTWNGWNDMRTSGNAINTNPYYVADDANVDVESGKLYYCSYMKCKNLPFGLVDDGLLISYMHRTDVKFGYQIYMTWNKDSLWTRNINHNTFSEWREILTARPANTKVITDANVATQNGMTYYCQHNTTRNLPYSNDDGIIQVFSMNNGVGNQTVCVQMWYSWNTDVVCHRKCIWGSWGAWKRIVTTNP